MTDDPIPRDMFYDGRLKYEKAAVVLRIAPTWFRMGSFEILSRNAEIAELKQLLQFIIKENFPHIIEGIRLWTCVVMLLNVVPKF